MSEMPYAAFISYRHSEGDRVWAKWLHTAIETYRTPRLLVKAGVRARVGRVFRDEEELAASPHLSESIEAALDDSAYLIVVCSPRTPESRWVEQEVLRFLNLGRGDHILALLIEGEPEASFPVPLRSSEPLAGDVRPQSGESARQRRESAKLRLLAALLGCQFDDLRRREHERQRRSLRVWAASASLLLLIVSGLALFAWRQRNRAEAETIRAQREAKIARAQALAAQAQLTLATTPISDKLGTSGPQRAILLALEALRIAPVLEADTALRNALAKLPQPALPSWLSIPKGGYEGDAPPAPESLISPDRHYRAVSPQGPEEPVVIEDLRSKRTWRLPHEWVLQAIRFSADSSFLCTVTGQVSMDARSPDATELYGSTIRVWELPEMRLRTRVSLADQAGIVRAVFSPDSSTLATIGSENQEQLWTLWPHQLEREACSRLTRNLSPSEWHRYFGDGPARETCPGLPVISE